MRRLSVAKAALLAAALLELACVAAGGVGCARVDHVLGSSAGGVLVSVAVYTLWRGREGLLLALSLVLAASVAAFLKQAVAAPRPPRPLWLVEVEGPSFPSGHAAGSAALAASVALSTGLDPLVTAALSLHAVAVALSRLVLHVHYPLDVAAGLLLGAAAAVAAHAAWARLPPGRAITVVGGVSAALGLASLAAGAPYRDPGVVAGAGLGLALSPLALKALEGWEECLESKLGLREGFTAFAMAGAAALPVLLSHTALEGLAAGFSTGLAVPLSRPAACRLWASGNS
ncbi:phosphatase PAP2 family protein [Stetteria hydrogenophila]